MFCFGDVDVAIIGGGIAGMSTAYALRSLSVVVLERDVICGPRSATFAAAQGHVYARDGWDEPLQRASIDVYRELEAESGIGLESHGAATLSLQPTQAWGWLNSSGLADHGISWDGGAWDYGAHAVEPCRALEAMKRHVRVIENADIVAVDDDAVRLADGTTITARAVVLALGVWRDDFVRRFFDLPGLISPVMGQIQAFATTTRLSAASVFIYGDSVNKTKNHDCGLDYFLTRCDGEDLATYVYAKARPAQLVVGTRREIVELAKCGSGFDDTLAAQARDLAFRAFGVGPQAPRLTSSYTACFPVASDGQVQTAQLGPRLFEINGLAGGGIARGPGAAMRLASLIRETLRI